MLKVFKNLSRKSFSPVFRKSQRNNSGFHKSQNLSALVEVFIDDKSIKVDSTYTIFQACYEAG